MAIAQLEFPRFKAFNTSGKVLSGGKVYVYEAGTSTKKTIWKDSNKNSKHSNPVTLDTNGEAEIWFEGPIKIVLEDSDGNQQWTMDNIESDIPPSDVGRFNLIENGSFEIDSDADNLPDSWTITEFANDSTVELDSSDVVHGANALKFDSQGSGGGTATTDDLFEVNQTTPVVVAFSLKCSVADITNSVEVRWHDKDETFLSSTTVYNENSSNPTSWTEKRFSASPPSNATYAKLKITGADSGNSTPGTAFYDDIKVFTDGQSGVYTSNSSLVEFQDDWTFSGTGGDVTASASEINKVDGLTRTTSQLNDTLVKPGSSSDPSPSFNSWRTPNQNRPTVIAVEAQANSSSSALSSITLSVDSDGGTTSDYTLQVAWADGASLGAYGQQSTTTALIPAGGSYRIVNSLDPAGGNKIESVREWTI